MRLPRCLTWMTHRHAAPTARSTAWTCGALWWISALLVMGCATDSSPSRPVMLSTDPWTYEGHPARNLHTAHYLIHTTITDEKFLQRLAQTLEATLEQYHNLAPDVPLTTRP